MRAYTPTSSDDNLGYFDLVIKVRCAPVCATPCKLFAVFRKEQGGELELALVMHAQMCGMLHAPAFK